MAYQNVATPRFYIDYLSYWESLGLIKEIYGYGAAGTFIEKGSFVGLDPSLPCEISMSTTNVPGGTTLYIDLAWESFISRKSLDSMNYVGILGHNINQTFDGSDPGSVRINFDKRKSDDAILGHHLWRGALTNPTSIINAEKAYTEGDEGTFAQLPNAGFSIFGTEFAYGGSVEYDENGDVVPIINHDNAKADRISLALRWFKDEAFLTTISGNAFVNSLCFGHYYDMPVSPDLALNMEIQFDGYSSIKTLGGSTLNRTRYKGAPKWGEYNPWEIGEPGGSITRNGRRVWNLKFSYISDNDLFASNYMTNNHLNYNSTNTEYNTNNDLTDDSSEFQYTLEDDSSFIAKVLNFVGNGERFIFQPNNDSSNPSDYAICVLDQKSFKITQKAYKSYNISMKIMEVW